MIPACLGINIYSHFCIPVSLFLNPSFSKLSVGGNTSTPSGNFILGKEKRPMFPVPFRDMVNVSPSFTLASVRSVYALI